MGIRITRVYTRQGDGGMTQLVGGQQVEKDSRRIECYGTVDELNAVLGLVASEDARADIQRVIRRVQHELFNLGSDLATRPADRHPQQPVLEEPHVRFLESEIDRMNTELPTLRSFVLPGGGRVTALLHQARTVCRRAERLTVGLARLEEVSPNAVPYLNRLSDFLFVLGRWNAKRRGEEEVLWTPEEA